jgi:hypothetical protein
MTIEEKLVLALMDIEEVSRRDYIWSLIKALVKEAEDEEVK